MPKLVLYDLEPGPNEALPDAPWAWSASVLPQTGAPESDLSAFFRKLEPREERRAVRKVVTEDKGEKKGSDHIARLWASEQVLSLLSSHKAEGRPEAVALASRFRLVTPVSGAVVLQTAQQYAQNNLTPVAPGTVPAVPEPEEWALILMVSAVMSWLGPPPAEAWRWEACMRDRLVLVVLTASAVWEGWRWYWQRIAPAPEESLTLVAR